MYPIGNPREMSIECEATDGSQATQALFEASEIKVVKLVLGTTKILLTIPEHEDESRTLNICVWHEGSAHQQQPTGVAAADSVTSSGSQVEPVDMEEMTKEEFVEKLRGWMMVLASLFSSLTFQAGLNPPKQFQADLIMEHGAGNSIQLMSRGRVFFMLSSFVFDYSLGLVMLMLFQPSLSVERLLGKRGFLSKSKRGLLCSNIVMLLLVFALGSANSWYDMPFAPFSFLLLFARCTSKTSGANSRAGGRN